MCGIAGILATADEAGAVRADITAMAHCLRHRGPDDQGVAVGRGWGLSMRRLSIQDTSHAGHQPMRLRDLTIAFNGEVYNFPTLRKELEREGYGFRSGSDTEVVLAALDHWGTDALTRFNGMFALALVDERRRRAWLARDRFGKKPLFVARLRGGVHFASELKALVAIRGAELTLSEQSLREYFRFRYVPEPLSIFREAEKLPAGTWVEVDLDSGELSAPTPFWSLPAHDAHATPATPVEVVDAVQESVRRRLISDVPVGAFLSGGTDSSLVVACMREAAADVRTFSIGFTDPRFDETAYADAVARHLGTRHTHRRLEPSDAMHLVPSLGEVYDEPFADSSALPMLAVARLAREHVTVALSGDGGDELFGGYRRYRLKRIRLAAVMPRKLAGPLRRLPSKGRLRRGLRIFATLASAGGEGEVYREATSVWRTAELDGLLPGVPDREGPRTAFAAAGTGPIERMMRWDARTYLVDDILQKVDRASMSVSLEARNPLLDPEVVELAMRSVGRAEAAPGEKLLLREALALRLPAELVDRPKMGFGVPVGEWMRGGLRPLVDDLLLGRSPTDYDPRAARAIVEGHLSGRREEPQKVWTLLMYELWRDRWRSASMAGTTGGSCSHEVACP